MVSFKRLQLGKEVATLASGIVINIFMPQPGIHSNSVYRAVPYLASTVGLPARKFGTAQYGAARYSKNVTCRQLPTGLY